MEEILENKYYSSLVVLISQIVFLYLRTLNIIYTADNKMVPAIITQNGVGLMWLISISIGVKSIMGGDALPIIMYLIGGSLGTYWGMKKESKNWK
jgi:uncharacterized protein YebE (UPF0316 family)